MWKSLYERLAPHPDYWGYRHEPKPKPRTRFEQRLRDAEIAVLFDHENSAYAHRLSRRYERWHIWQPILLDRFRLREAIRKEVSA